MNQRIILGSQSPARKTVFEKLNIPFEVITSDFVEDMTLPLPAPELALHLSQGKASSLAKKYSDAVIIAADTFLIFQGRFLGKPKDTQDAKERLAELAGNTHTIITGLTVMMGDRAVSEVVLTEVTMKNSNKEKIEEYVKTGEPMGKAGSYAIQGKGKELIEKISGDYFNILGLPLKTLVGILNQKFSVPVNFPGPDSESKIL